MDRDMRVAVIVASTREGRLGATVGEWFTRHARGRDDMDVDAIDLAETPLPRVVGAEHPDGFDEYLERLRRADGFVIVTPEYNHGYPGDLKNAIDMSGPAWQAKPVAFVSYGGLGGGLRSVEQLRLVFAELHATTVRDVVSLHNPWNLFDEDARMVEDIGAEAAADLMLDRLAWWTRALLAAREEVAYAA